DVTLKGDQYVLNYMGVKRIFDGKKIYTIIPEDEEINISNGEDEDENEITPSEMLTFYQKGYTYAMDITQNVQGRKIQFVKLTPIDSKSEYKKILLGIDSQTKHIYNLIQIGKNGTETLITVNSFKTNLQLSETLFTFDKNKYSGYYINDLD
ncbi:MAG: outer membrane lipoprotein carrier protein LolA, partial [Flavobacteriaceae bacterium]|nr:outer membrane lipoprotein carrier protein LolA [Flavobacteriaceae bacterium]